MPKLLVADVAAELGVKQATWRAYVSRGKAPAPDGRFGREPWWKPETVEAWRNSRPRAGKSTVVEVQFAPDIQSHDSDLADLSGPPPQRPMKDYP